MSDLIGPGEAARRLGVSSRTVQRWLRSGVLPPVRVGTRLKVPVSALTQMAEPASRWDPAPPGAPSTPPTTIRPIRRLLVANRGELVARITRTARRLGITTLALVTGDQRGAWWTRQADEEVTLGASDGEGETTYLDGAAIIRAALAAGADAIHPGYGFLAERPDFAEAVTAAGMIWVGPPPDAMLALGDKAAARRLATGIGVPILPGYDGRGQSDAVLTREAARVGYPVLVKPSAGGGGKGMHLVRDRAELPKALARARREATGAFGDDRLILERYLERPRHVEVQVLLDANGDGVHLGERDCSLQRRHQKVVEEAPAPAVGPELRDRMGEAALLLARAAGYVGAGTAEFLLSDVGHLVFLEVNARLQVEHPVTEAVTGIDLVEEQLRIAAGEPLRIRQSDVTISGHAVEARLYAEDPWADFVPATGRIVDVGWPGGAGIRVDAGVGSGDEVGTRYDPLLAKIIARGTDRREALARLDAALGDTHTLGVTTNRGFLRALLAMPDVVAGDGRTDTIEARWRPTVEGLPDAAWEVAGMALDRRAGFRLNGPRRLPVEIDGERRTLMMAAPLPSTGPTDDAPIGPAGVVWALLSSGDGVVLDVDGRALTACIASPPTVEGAARRAHHVEGAPASVSAPMPGVVLDIRVNGGEVVEAHQVLLVLEAMKMENAVTAPIDATVARLLVRRGQAVQRGDVLLELEG